LFSYTGTVVHCGKLNWVSKAKIQTNCLRKSLGAIISLIENIMPEGREAYFALQRAVDHRLISYASGTV
jgi:hypothetical protein